MLLNCAEKRSCCKLWRPRVGVCGAEGGRMCVWRRHLSVHQTCVFTNQDEIGWEKLVCLHARHWGNCVWASTWSTSAGEKSAVKTVRWGDEFLGGDPEVTTLSHIHWESDDAVTHLLWILEAWVRNRGWNGGTTRHQNEYGKTVNLEAFS